MISLTKEQNKEKARIIAKRISKKPWFKVLKKFIEKIFKLVSWSSGLWYLFAKQMNESSKGSNPLLTAKDYASLAQSG